MTRLREPGSLFAAVCGWLAAFVALWTLAGCLAALIYRAEQIEAHQCLRGLPLPSGYLQVGLIALAMASALGGAAALARQDRKRRLRRASIAGFLVFAPLVAATIAVYLEASPAETMRRDVCTGSISDYVEESR